MAGTVPNCFPWLASNVLANRGRQIMRMLSKSEVAHVGGAFNGVSRETIGCAVGGAIGTAIGGIPGGLVGCAGGALAANNMAIGGTWYGPFGGSPAGLRAWLIHLYTR
ncbi:hypothetical protein [Stenotrophomonas panacihumi]|uniref:hypothetical protein n=1 Tax=Stenotrophomonas panacihumi TaxID=676599 RepID=UPI0011B21889|nr:hypothetical protein [Stenotrophomonas panacihumi]